MQQPAPDHIRSALQAALTRGTSVVLATVSNDGMPSTAFCSWVVAANPTTIALALDSRSTAHRNISAGSRQVALEVLADDMILAVRGEATVVKEQLRSVPFPCALVTVSIADVRDHGVGGVIFKPPQYLFADGKEHRGEVERAIFEELAREHHRAGA
ncbi:MAG: pyridoxamine 5'-phosphate oxidase family protein [Candidatus Eremiobacteraeota bacterium]|nr:pyridoxamine 5'-phosphate oxidase family protein [Candidatus Eremiobacteraeota bacterium]